MRILDSQLIHLPVETESGTVLGRIRRLVIDPESHTVEQYMVRTFPYIFPFCSQRVIHRTQVVRITTDAMVVEDTASRVLGEDVAQTTPTIAEAP